jgi:hypothetical protein
VTTPAPPAIQCPGTLSGGTCQLPAVAALRDTVNVTFTATGTGPFTWTAPSAPANLMMVSTTGVLTGEATQPGANQPFTVTVRDAAGQSANLNCTITIPAAPQLKITAPPPPNTLPGGTVGTAYTGFQFQATGGLPPYTWESANLPPGLAFNSSGAITGTPTTAQASPDMFQVTVFDSQQPNPAFANTATLSITITSAITGVVISPKFTTIDASGSQVTLNASVNGTDPFQAGVNWTRESGSPLMSCGNLGQVTPCGTLTPVESPSFSATYLPPTSVPGAPNNTPTITATAVDDTGKSDTNPFTINMPGAAACPVGRESAMSGSFAYLMKGFDANGAVAIAGSFHADGTGKITSGV